jgi:tripartite-type tricarboxylate transporter receptor subunit TctC
MSGHKRRIFVAVAVLLLFWLAAMVNVEAKEVYPSKPITLIVPFPPGGSTDVAARTMAVYMGKALNTSVIISNIPGAGGAIGYTKGYQAKPDGYTLLAWNTLPPLLEEYKRSVAYKTLNFTSIGAFSRDFSILVVHPEVSKNLTDFVKLAKSQNVNVGTTGQYTITGLQGILMTEELGLKTNWVNFGGGAESLTSLAGKHIEAVLTLTGSAMPLIKAGKILPLAIFSEKRSNKFPTVPVPSEQGFNLPILYSYTGIVGPPGLDKAKVKILEEAIVKATKYPDYVNWTEKVSTAEPILLSASAYQKETARLAKVADKYKHFLKGN